jgi:NADPH:quinone reductase-like Zn-dependent oxidoreductase
MQVVTYSNYGPPDVLRPSERPKPAPKPDQVLVRIHATTVTSGDYRARSLDLPRGFGLIGRLAFGLFRPRRAVLGTEYAGVVESVGANVTRFKSGDRVFAYPGAKFGGYADYAVIGEEAAIAIAPKGFDLGEAAAISFGGGTALDFLRNKGGIKTGDRVLIIGASGGVGSAAVQIAKAFGAHVTGVASTPHLETVSALGADAVLDYTRDDPAGVADGYDIILDTSGTATYAKYGTALRPNGRLLLVSADLWQLLGSLLARKQGGRKAIGGYAPERAEDLRYLASLAEAGRFKPHIGRRFPFAQIVEAHAWFNNPGKAGNIVVLLDDSGKQSAA